MLISGVEDGIPEGRQTGSQRDRGRLAASGAHEFQTATQLLDMMAVNNPFEDVSETLSTRDLVILYENIDLGTKLMSNPEEYTKRLTRKPNQRVESIVYNDDLDSEGSEASEICDAELHDACKINKERLDLFSNRPSLENTLCQKLGDLEIQTSSLSFRYDQHFIFKDPYIKEQLKNLSKVDSQFDGSALPASLLDYICCKRLEDNYNFYLDNIIRYVKHTIEQLKRISNGDYLTDKAKEKWREVEDVARNNDNSKVLATSTSIPLQVEKKVNGLSTTWDDIIHSEVDIRSLSKILEKKIIVEIPKMISGSYKLFSKLYSDNLVISCKREQQAPAEEEARVDVVLQLGRSNSGQVISNISSIMVLHPTPPILAVECPKALPLPCNQLITTNPNTNDDKKIEKKTVTIVEIPSIIESTVDSSSVTQDSNGVSSEDNNYDNLPSDEIYEDSSQMDDENNYLNESNSGSGSEFDNCNVALRDIVDAKTLPDLMEQKMPYSVLSPDDLSLTILTTNMSSLPEEVTEDTLVIPVNKKKSQTKVRIKSPYENKSQIMEEKKRKKLLEIREKREKKKIAISESCKITKNKYGKGPMPQSSSSVTKLSITNKSFYNSIYGQKMNMEQSTVAKVRQDKKVSERENELPLELLEGEVVSPLMTPNKNYKKFINRSYYLDEAVTEMMYTDNKHSECSSARDVFSGSTSAASGDFNNQLNMISQILNNSVRSDMRPRVSSSCDHINNCFDDNQNFKNDIPANEGEDNCNTITTSKIIHNTIVPTNSPKREENDVNIDSKKTPFTVECRKSIDRLYDLMKNTKNVNNLAQKSSKSKCTNSEQDTFTAQGSESGTSLKHFISSNPSTFSFDKTANLEENIALKNTSTKKTNALTAVIPKVIINAKQHNVKNEKLRIEGEKPRKEYKKLNSIKVTDNPLKAISQILHEFDNVQKTRHKTSTDNKPTKKLDSSNTFINRRSRLEQHMKDGRDRRGNEIIENKNVKVLNARERKPKPTPPTEMLKIPHQQIPSGDRPLAAKKKITDIIDEVREAKGEAVRGPSKFSSRLNTLAQPKKSYVQAHSEEYQTKYGRNLMADRLHRLASGPAQAAAPAPPPPPRPRPRRHTDAVSSVSVRHPPMQPLERGARYRRSAGNSPAGRAPPPPPDATAAVCLANDVPEAMKTKMGAVETYLKSHYGHWPSSMKSELFKARVPVVPNDIDTVSVQSSPTGDDSSDIGNRLHSMISRMSLKVPLTALAETHETVSKPSSTEVNFSGIFANTEVHEHASSVDSDFPVDIFEDKHVKTAVQNITGDLQLQPIVENPEADSKETRDLHLTSGEFQKQPEEALAGCISVGTFQKNLRIKNFTLTPRRSKRQFLFLESGDVGSILLKSDLSKNFRNICSRSEINDIVSIENRSFGWDFANIPMQVATVGYAFPEYCSTYSQSLAIKSLDNILNLKVPANISLTTNTKKHKTNQCLKCVSASQLKYQNNGLAVSTEKTTKEIDAPTSPNKNEPLTTASIVPDVHVNRVDETKGGDSATSLNINKPPKEVEEFNTENIQSSIDCTSSLDMLVGILNEIQNITTCHMTNANMYDNELDCHELENIICSGAGLKNVVQNSCSRELVSITSLDKLRQLESSSSIYSLLLSNKDKNSIVNKISIPRLKTSSNVLCNSKPMSVDKEVSTNFPVKELTHTFTDVPSKFFPITIAHSTNVTNSLGILSKPSGHSLKSLQDTTTNTSEVIEIIKKSEPTELHQMPTIECSKIAKIVKQTQKRKKIAVENKISFEIPHRKLATEIAFYDQSKFSVKKGDFDPMIKMKRDILVTVYSVLVLTVFAALSFPEILYHV